MDFPIRIFRVADKSMEPTLNPGDYVFVNGFSKKIKINDVVVVKHPSKNIYIIKRVKKVDGDRYYVLGDNAGKSDDSRKFGMLGADGLVGKLIFKL